MRSSSGKQFHFTEGINAEQGLNEMNCQEDFHSLEKCLIWFVKYMIATRRKTEVKKELKFMLHRSKFNERSLEKGYYSLTRKLQARS